MGYWNGKPSYSTRHIKGLEHSFGWFVEGSDVAFTNILAARPLRSLKFSLAFNLIQET